MADVNVVPRICCDNCGKTVDKHQSGTGPSATFSKPSMWGSCRIEGGRDVDSYGMKSRITFGDLCPECANAAIDAAAAALKAARGGEA